MESIQIVTLDPEFKNIILAFVFSCLVLLGFASGRHL